MEIIIHDLPEKKLKNIYKSTDNSLIISDDKKIKNSDIVRTNNQYYVGAGLRYSF